MTTLSCLGLTAVGWPGGVLAARSLLTAEYGLYSSGLHIAKLEFSHEMADDAIVAVAFTMKNRGLAALFGGKHRLEMRAEYGKGGLAQPIAFTTFNDKPDRDRQVTVSYGNDGQIVDVEVDNDGRKRPSHVPKELWPGSVDPMTGLARMQKWAPLAKPGDAFEAPLFDGRKRADLLALKRQDQGLDIVLNAVFGFDKDDEFVSWPGSRTNLLRLFLDDSQPPMPTRLTMVNASLGTELRLTEKHERAL